MKAYKARVKKEYEMSWPCAVEGIYVKSDIFDSGILVYCHMTQLMSYYIPEDQIEKIKECSENDVTDKTSISSLIGQEMKSLTVEFK
jgi:hypothetical protein